MDDIKTVSPGRRAAFISLCKMRAGKYTNLEVGTVLSRMQLSEADRGLYTALVYGVTERLITLDYMIAALSKRVLSALDEEVLCALRLGLYQLAFMDRIPPHAAVSQSVALTPAKGRGFVNALLRTFIRGGSTVPMPEKDGAEALSVRYSIPISLCNAFIEWLGSDTAEKVFAAFLEKEDAALRINTLRHSTQEAAQRINGVVSNVYGACVRKSSFAGVLSGVEAGDWFVQDEASALCAHIVGARPGETVVDVCAAPGGKSFAMAIEMENQGKIHAFDLHGNKLSLIQRGAEKLGISILETEERDARNPKKSLIGQADRVLCDAPCSGLGVIGKKPDIKYKEMETMARLPEVQYAVLVGAAAYVRSGGTLVYSTCTLNPAENEGVTERFLTEHPEFEPFPFPFAGTDQSTLTLLPHIHGTDGFYICRMQRK
ncbi:MAG: 16S rRNA (cytosine(967)-C(5))-methyltransferase RsmB [Clostridiales bacterium]|jgi:16S rRNA (cytosine967-C5)-methyltransferase|nr:16S rRNA (cytosine(967)-C(5))-methyltransferase RsmB [Clostridiales bacterium]